jgi:hypothetical protein
LTSLQSALQIAQKIKALLDTDQWEKIPNLIELRDSHINKAEAEDINMTSQEQKATREVLNELQMLNDVLMSAAQIHRDDLFQQIKKSNKSKQMNKAYKQI